MADWKKNLLPASFRGVPFFIQGSDYVTGRRTTQHEFPDRNDPYAEDLGKISDTFTFDGHLIGDDYFEQRNALIEAFQKEGPGELIHPYYGIKFVQCGSTSFKESQEEGRIVRFTVTFREAGENRFPKGANDKGAILLDATKNAKDIAAAEFAENLVVDGQPGFSLDTVRGAISSAQTAFNNSTKDFATLSDGIAELAFSTRNLVAETEDLLKSPANLASRLLGSMELMRNAVNGALASFGAYKSLFKFGDDEPEPIDTTPTRKTIKKNKAVFDNFIKTAAALNATEDAANADFESLEQAQQARDDLLELLDTQTDTTENDDLYQALKNVTASLIELVPDSDADLPRIKKVIVPNTTDTLTLSYDLFEKISSEQDIIDRNNISNPAFIQPDKELEVIDDIRQSEN